MIIYFISIKLYVAIKPQPYHPAAQDRLPTEAKQGWSPGKTRLLLEEVLVRPAGGAHPAVCVGPKFLTPQYSDGDTILSKSTVFRMKH